MSSPDSKKTGDTTEGQGVDASEGEADGVEWQKGSTQHTDGSEDGDLGSGITGLITEDENGHIEIDQDELIVRCDSNIAKTFKTNLKFPSNVGEQCDFGVDGNLTAGSAYDIRAVREFSKPIALPTNRKRTLICDLSISTENKYTVYDDDIVVTLNHWIIASDYLGKSFYETRHLERFHELFKYDFSKIAGASWPKETIYKGPGVNGVIDTRQNSKTQREGVLSFAMGHEFLLAMPARELINPNFKFSFFIHGNRAIDNDCQHHGFDFAVEVKYLE